MRFIKTKFLHWYWCQTCKIYSKRCENDAINTILSTVLIKTNKPNQWFNWMTHLYAFLLQHTYIIHTPEWFWRMFCDKHEIRCQNKKKLLGYVSVWMALRWCACVCCRCLHPIELCQTLSNVYIRLLIGWGAFTPGAPDLSMAIYGVDCMYFVYLCFFLKNFIFSSIWFIPFSFFSSILFISNKKTSIYVQNHINWIQFIFVQITISYGDFFRLYFILK